MQGMMWWTIFFLSMSIHLLCLLYRSTHSFRSTYAVAFKMTKPNQTKDWAPITKVEYLPFPHSFDHGIMPGSNELMVLFRGDTRIAGRQRERASLRTIYLDVFGTWWQATECAWDSTFCGGQQFCNAGITNSRLRWSCCSGTGSIRAEKCDKDPCIEVVALCK